VRQFIWHDADSYLHRLNPLTKLALTLPIAAVVVTCDEPATPLAVAVVTVLATCWLGSVPWTSVLLPLALALAAGFGMFWTGLIFYAGPGASAAPVVIGPVQVSEASILYAVTMMSRLLAIVAASLLFVLTTNPVDFVVALIQQARLPVRVGYAIFAAYRFMPLVHEELLNIQAAHQVRGAAMGGGPVARVRQAFGYAIPLLAISVRRAERVALAMDARGFSAHRPRTYYRTTTFTRSDLQFAVGALTTLVAVVVLTRLLDW